MYVARAAAFRYVSAYSLPLYPLHILRAAAYAHRRYTPALTLYTRPRLRFTADTLPVSVLPFYLYR